MDLARTGRPAAVVLLALLAVSCAPDSQPQSQSQQQLRPQSQQPPDTPTTSVEEEPHGTGAGSITRPTSEPEPTAGTAVAPDLRHLADGFVGYALGRSPHLPHAPAVELTIGGEPAGTVAGAALPDRADWVRCPDGWEGYAAASCPIDLLGPVRTAAVNGAELVLSTDLGEVSCAPERTAPLPAGRRVVLRLRAERRSCAQDFALVLVADDRGRLRAVDLTLSNP